MPSRRPEMATEHGKPVPGDSLASSPPTNGAPHSKKDALGSWLKPFIKGKSDKGMNKLPSRFQEYFDSALDVSTLEHVETLSLVSSASQGPVGGAPPLSPAASSTTVSEDIITSPILSPSDTPASGGRRRLSIFGRPRFLSRARSESAAATVAAAPTIPNASFHPYERSSVDDVSPMPSPNQISFPESRRYKLVTTLKSMFAAEPEAPSGIFGVPLNQSMEFAKCAISLTDENGDSYVYGYVPIVVAKCGVFLKDKATDIEGIFRLSGSAKRIKDLQAVFDSPPKYGKGLVWDGYTVHDAANVLRRYLNQLPEPIIPLNFYDDFRQPLKGHVKPAFGDTDAQTGTLSEGFDVEAAIKVYKSLVVKLPAYNRQLLLYILDLLAVFASKQELNLMTAANLSAIFQPGLLSHPSHDMAPPEYRLSQDVLIFLIEHQDHFLLDRSTSTAAGVGDSRQ